MTTAVSCQAPGRFKPEIRAEWHRPLGILCMAVSFFLFLALLSGEDLSFVLPATALAYVMSVLGAMYILKETVSASRWIGTLIICAGVALITLK